MKNVFGFGNNTKAAMSQNTAFSARPTENSESDCDYANIDCKGTASAVSFVVAIHIAVDIIVIKIVDIISSVRLIIKTNGTAYKDIRNKAQA